MSTVIRPELSPKNHYRIEKHRYYELKHFCLQYPIWRKARAALDGYGKHSPQVFVTHDTVGDPTADCAEIRVLYADRMALVERAARETDGVLGPFILKAVTEGLSYDILRVNDGIPCGKDMYYDLYRRFFWLLNQIRN